MVQTAIISTVSAARVTWPTPQVLEGTHVRLEPLELRHAPGMFDVADPETFKYMLWTPDPWGVEGFEEWIRRRQGDAVPYAVIEKATGKVVGATTYLETNQEHRGLEIGYTWYGAAYRGTVVNPESKFLLLSRAFDDLHCVRVQLKCDNRNERSKAGILKLGATFEGVLRNHRILPDGHLRQTAYFSILQDEWPAVRGRLVERIAAFQP